VEFFDEDGNLNAEKFKNNREISRTKTAAKEAESEEKPHEVDPNAIGGERSPSSMLKSGMPISIIT